MGAPPRGRVARCLALVAMVLTSACGAGGAAPQAASAQAKAQPTSVPRPSSTKVPTVSPSSAPTRTPSPTPTNTAARATQAAKTLGIAQTLNTNEWDYTVTSVERAASIDSSVGPLLPVNGNYLLVYLTVTNKQSVEPGRQSDYSLSPTGRGGFMLYDPAGHGAGVDNSTPAEEAARNAGLRLYSDSVLPAESMDTVLVFDVG